MHLEKQTRVRHNGGMSRFVFAKGKQRLFLEEAKAKTGLSWDQLAGQLGLCGRTLRDWRREKYLMTLGAAQQLSSFALIPLPEPLEVRLECWSCGKAASMGGIVRLLKYGPPGTPEGRRKGGLKSGQLRRLYPERYCSNIKRKEIIKPDHSTLLAEFVGILLGDGGITRYQTTVSLNSSTDAEYVKYILYMFNVLFGVTATVQYRSGNTCFVRASSVELSEYLVSIGHCVGDKIRNRADIPVWIFDNKEYMKACLRGPIDTDGCVGRKNYHAKTLAMQINFRNESAPLLQSARKLMIQLGFSPSRITKSNHIHLTRKDDIRKYIMDVGFSNSKHSKRIQSIKDQFRRGA